MTEQTKKMAVDAMNKAAPWRKGVAWWVIMLQGLVALAIGIYLVSMNTAGPLTIQLFAIYLLIVSIERIMDGFRKNTNPAVVAQRMLRAGIGLTVGTIIVADMWKSFMAPPSPTVVLSIGWLLTGIFGLWEWAVGRKQLGWGFGGLIAPLIFTIFGVLMLASGLALGPIVLQWFGILAVTAGIALLVYAFVVYQKSKTSAEA
jgi:uncharacterized membrane protein HdeD (DUF308 family)